MSSKSWTLSASRCACRRERRRSVSCSSAVSPPKVFKVPPSAPNPKTSALSARLPKAASHNASPNNAPGSAFDGFFVPSKPKLCHAHDFEDHRHRPAGQRQAVERRDKADQAVAGNRQGIAIAERRIILEGKFDKSRVVELQRDPGVVAGPHRDIGNMGAHKGEQRDEEQRG